MPVNVSSLFTMFLLLASGIRSAPASSEADTPVIQDIMSVLVSANGTVLTDLQVGDFAINDPWPLPMKTPSTLSTPKSQPAVTTNTTSKLVFAHHIVGNTYNYTVSAWTADIKLAASKGIDAFALNIGADSWESTQVAYAYAAAKSFNGTFKLFMSFDMTSLPCATTADAATLRSYIKTYATHPNQLMYTNKAFVSTFAGQTCTFGQGSVNAGWQYAVKGASYPSTYFVPAFFVDPATFPQYTVIDGAFNWNSGWPQGDYDIDFTQDQSYISNLASKSYMAAASPWFFTHYGVNSYNKNFIYRGDDWLFAERWEGLIANRSVVNFVEVNTWNDYGESHYVGPVTGIQPMSQQWVNGFDHTAWLDLMQYYISSFKNGTYQPVTKDRTFLWARLYPANATAPDSVGKPTNWQWTQDYLWAVVLLTSPANVTLSCGNSTMTASAPAGVSKFQLPLVTDCSVSSSVTRGLNSTSFNPSGFNFSTTPPSYNFNAFVAASP